MTCILHIASFIFHLQSSLTRHHRELSGSSSRRHLWFSVGPARETHTDKIQFEKLSSHQPSLVFITLISSEKKGDPSPHSCVVCSWDQQFYVRQEGGARFQTKLKITCWNECGYLPSKGRGGGPNGPPGFKKIISLEPKVGLTSNQAVNLSLWFVLRTIKKIGPIGPLRVPGGPFSDEHLISK